ncbi:SRPBCC family protein [Fluviicola taffensis]|uniref:Activator of Hsp90 ATPase 1 family protein n=1 Tax=Fluviicola taffensis (strain DSM 16823 / NCIMB 13979 / RW262) TaxID=755732 RepID=F2IIC8_FLUTR|nr:SRPBCC domain-containing protein [Fluviicola taffensis]AEA44854.1 Activator of Hsp90 ATPase 1 family protein [Fluviicola taffensis DSM 16823]
MIIRQNNYELRMPNYEFSNHPKRIEKSILIQDSPAKIWEYLTNPDLMKQWMGDPEMNIEVITDWKVGNPFGIKGFHHLQFENKGTILQFEPEKIFQYEYLSSMSNLADTPENHTMITFNLVPKAEKTELIVEAENFPSKIIYKHLEFYWNGTVTLLKNLIEKDSLQDI